MLKPLLCTTTDVLHKLGPGTFELYAYFNRFILGQKLLQYILKNVHKNQSIELLKMLREIGRHYHCLVNSQKINWDYQPESVSELRVALSFGSQTCSCFLQILMSVSQDLLLYFAFLSGVLGWCSDLSFLSQ